MLGALILLLVSGCQSTGGAGDCTIRKGTTTEELIACGCVRASSGGGTVMAERGGGRGPELIISMVHYICPLGEGKGKYARVSVVNGLAERVWY
jgi:hypothetical protein